MGPGMTRTRGGGVQRRARKPRNIIFVPMLARDRQEYRGCYIYLWHSSDKGIYAQGRVWIDLFGEGLTID